MLVGAAAELVSLGAVVPFIAILSNPSVAAENDVIRLLLTITNKDTSYTVIIVTLAFASIVILASSIRLVMLWASNKVVFGLGYDIGVDVVSKTLHRPYTWHVSKNSSEILGALNKVQLVVQGYLLPLMNATISVILATGMIAMLVFIDPFVAIAGAGAFMSCYLTMAFSVRKRVTANGKQIAAANNQRIQQMQESLGSIRDVILDSSQKIYVKKFSAVDAAMRTAQASNTFLSNCPRLAIEGLGLLIISGFALIATRTGGLTDLLPVLGALGLGAQKLMPLIQLIYAGWNATTTNRPSLHDVINLINVSNIVDKDPVVRMDCRLKLSNVNYCYPTSPNSLTLKNVFCEIGKGQVVGIVGKTGSGKSTLVDLLMGLLPHSSGDFLIDDTRVETDDQRRSWSSQVAHVPQMIFLSDASIAENIALGVSPENIDYQRVQHAARLSEIHDYVEALPDAYNTEVGERGVRLSGGQRQRIGIARALYRDAKFLVLDEATSALDDATEARVIRNIHESASDLTLIMVAHRLSTLQYCDHILKIENGSIVDSLSFTQLVETTPH